MASSLAGYLIGREARGKAVKPRKIRMYGPSVKGVTGARFRNGVVQTPNPLGRMTRY